MENKLFKVKLFSLTIIPLKKNSSINPIIKPDKTDKRIVTKNTLSISFILKLKILISKICNKIIIGKEAKQQILQLEKRLPNYLVACIGGGSNALGLFYPFLNLQ